MIDHRAAICALTGILAFASPGTGSAACSVNSGQKTTALIELYTSEGCSSCPPAEQALARLHQTLGPDPEWVALALHVNYWDYMGWQDPYAQAIFSDRHSWLVHANQHRVVYTPHFFVSGSELSARDDQLRAAIARVNRDPAAATIQLAVTDGVNGAQSVHATARAPAGADPLALYLAIAQNHIESRVARGENGGATLKHEHVARVWMGPIALTEGNAQFLRELSLVDQSQFEHGELVAFVEDERTGRVLQAVGLASCGRTDPH